MASPIWEEGTPTTPYRELDEDDVPLSFYGPGASLSPSSMGSNGAAGGVRRSHTVTAAGSRLHRISSGSSQTGSTAVGSLERPLSASTGVSRRTSMKTASPSLNRVMEGSASEDDQAPQLQAEQYPSNAYLPAETDFDNQALYSSAAASLARHSSMPVSRAFGRDPSNPGAPWQRTGYQQHPMSPPAAPPSDASSADAAVEQRIRSKSIAAESRLSGIMSDQLASPSSSSFYQPTSPNAPSSPLNSGFVVTSRPNSQIISGAPTSSQPQRNVSGHPSAYMSSAPGHGRSMSSHGWSNVDANSSTSHHSPTHSRHASDSVSSSQAQLGRALSNASSTKHNTTGSSHSHSNSTPSPASPIDSSLLGQNNPWSPTAEERLHFRELSSTLNLATLRQPGLTDGIIESSISPPHSSGPISPPSSRRGSGFIKDSSSPRRANSLNISHGRASKMHQQRYLEEPLPSVPMMASATTSSNAARLPQRRNTPILPPLVTSSEALYNGATEKGSTIANGQAASLATAAAGVQQREANLAQSTSASRALQMVQNGNGQPMSGPANSVGGGSKIIRGPVSAAPYVPPIGHTHASDRLAMSPEYTAQQAASARQGQDQIYHPRGHGQATAPVADVEHVNLLRGSTTAGPGMPESSYMQEKDRIAGLNIAQPQQQQQQFQQQQQVHPLSFPTPLSPQTANSLNSANPMQFPSLHNVDPAAAAAFTNNLQLQQQLLAQQTQQLHEQQNQLAQALASGMTLQDRNLATPNGIQPTPLQHHRQQGSLGSLPTSPNAQSQLQPNGDSYTIAAKIEALQRANAMLVAAMNEQNGQQQQQQQQLLQQQSLLLQQQSGLPQYQHALQHQNTYVPPGSMYAPPSLQHTPGSTMDLSRGPAAGNAASVPIQQRHEGVSPVDIQALTAAKGYNPREFDFNPPQARFFVIKSFTEDDVFKSIKFEIWSSTVLGNNRLDKAFAESAEKGPIYLFFSVNASGHFCGVAEMLTPLDYSVTSNVWAQGDKWKGVMKLRWIYIKDIPNPALRHLKLMNTNEQKPVTSSRDTQEVPYEQGCEMLRIFGGFQSKTSLLQDFAYYQAQTSTSAPANQAAAPPKTVPAYNGMVAPAFQSNPSASTQAGHPNLYQGPQHRSGTPQQNQYIPQHLPFPHQQQQQQPSRVRQTLPLKR